MQQQRSPIVTRRLACLVFVTTLAAAALPHAAGPDAHDNVLTFRQTLALPGTVVPAGTYVFEIATPGTGHDVVRVRSRDTGKPIFAGFTVKVTRQGRRDRQRPLTLGEVPDGSPVPILAWYPIGLPYGYQFIYR